MAWNVVETMVARFLECAVVTHWFPHTLVQIFSSDFGALKSLVLSFLFEYTNWSFRCDFLYNSRVNHIPHLH